MSPSLELRAWRLVDCGTPQARPCECAVSRGGVACELVVAAPRRRLCIACVLSRGQATPNRMAVSQGHYSVPETGAVSLRTAQLTCPHGHYCVYGIRSPCPAGRYGNSTGLFLEACSGPCAPGYYCDSGSLTATQFECGSDAVYCPSGSPAPIDALPGSLTTGVSSQIRSSVILCPSRYRCLLGLL